MDSTVARKDALALQYRLQVRLGMIARVARERGDAPASIEVTRLRKAVDAVRVGADEVTTQAASTTLNALEPDVSKLQEQLGIERYATPTIPKWVRFVTWMAPVIVLLLVLFVWFERRRRKVAMAESDLEALERSALDRGDTVT